MNWKISGASSWTIRATPRSWYDDRIGSRRNDFANRKFGQFKFMFEHERIERYKTFHAPSVQRPHHFRQARCGFKADFWLEQRNGSAESRPHQLPASIAACNCGQ
jgi:hypothetical protein